MTKKKKTTTKKGPAKLKVNRASRRRLSEGEAANVAGGFDQDTNTGTCNCVTADCEPESGLRCTFTTTSVKPTCRYCIVRS